MYLSQPSQTLITESNHGLIALYPSNMKSLTNLSFKTGSSKEREVYKKALKLLRVRNTGRRKKVTKPRRRLPVARRQNMTATTRKPTVSGKLKLDASPVIGQDILLTLALQNLTADFKTIKVKLKASAVLYTRKPKAEILQWSRSVQLGSEEGNFNLITDQDKM